MVKTFLAVAVLALGLAMPEPVPKAHAASPATHGTALRAGNGKAAGDLGAVKHRGWVLDSTYDTQYKADRRAAQLRKQGYRADVTYENFLYYVWRWQP
jgi:hypothetical protein